MVLNIQLSPSISLTHNLATTLSPNIRVNAVCPGWVNTDMNKELDSDYVKEECENIMLGRFANVREIANVIYFFQTRGISEEICYPNKILFQSRCKSYSEFQLPIVYLAYIFLLPSHDVPT